MTGFYMKRNATLKWVNMLKFNHADTKAQSSGIELLPLLVTLNTFSR